VRHAPRVFRSYPLLSRFSHLVGRRCWPFGFRSGSFGAIGCAVYPAVQPVGATDAYRLVGSMTTIHCRACWQPVTMLAHRCSHCGDTDKCRVRRAIAKLIVFALAAATVAGLAAWAYHLAAQVVAVDVDVIWLSSAGARILTLTVLELIGVIH
jgi:hypothetical protein